MEKLGKYAAPLVIAAVVGVGTIAILATLFTHKTETHPVAALAPTLNSAPLPQAATATDQTATDQTATRIRAAIAATGTDPLRQNLTRIYAAADNGLLWSGNGLAQRQLADMDAALPGLAAQGLDTSRFEAARKALAIDADRVRADLRFTTQVLVLAKSLRLGVLAGDRMEDWFVASDPVDIGAGLAEAVRNAKVADYVRGSAPQDPQYATLVSALARYSAIVAAGGWSPIPGDTELKVVAGEPRLPLLHARLVAEGYLPSDTKPTPEVLLPAIKVFQARNGLERDGRIGKGTLAALNVPAQQRAAQIVANLERRRHLPRATPADRIDVNTADQSLVLMKDGQPTLALRTIVGDRTHHTPMLLLKMNAVTLNPAWEIPPSISQKEILAKLKKNPNYLAENDMEIVGTPDDPHGRNIDWDAPTSMSMRLRQKPGDGNSLGQLKFQMQNPFNIYLHDTPNRAAFARQDRYLSHGCVRVDQPQELARHVLMDVPGWDADSLTATIAAGATRTVRLAKALPVYVMYWTVFADEAGQLQFRADGYGRDAPVAKALGYPPDRKPGQTQVAARDE